MPQGAVPARPNPDPAAMSRLAHRSRQTPPPSPPRRTDPRGYGWQSGGLYHPHHPRRCHSNPPRSGRNRPGMAFHRIRSRAKPRRLPRLPQTQQRHRLGGVTLRLHGKGDAVRQQRKVTDQVLVVFCRQFHLTHNHAICQYRQVRAHGINVQFGSVARVGHDAPIGHNQAAIAQQLDIMRQCRRNPTPIR